MNQKQARKEFKCARLTYFIDFILSMLTQTTYIMQNFTIIFNGTILHTVVKARSKWSYQNICLRIWTTIRKI